MDSVAPPESLDDRLEALARSIRGQQIRLGIALTLLTALALVVALTALDSAFAWSVLGRMISLAAGCAVVALVAWKRVWRPWREEPPVEEVAERIAILDAPNFVAALAREAKEHAAFPRWPGNAACVCAGIACLAGLAWVAAVPDAGERLRRIALPWHHPASAAPYEIVVVSGETVARRGAPLTLSAYLRPRDPAAPLPDAAALHLRTIDGTIESIEPMIGTGGAFHLTLPDTARDFEYRVEIAGIVSDWFAVRFADAVELAPGSTITLEPPAYRNALVKPSSGGFTDLEGLQYSTALIHLAFNRPAESAVLEWRPEGRNPFEAPDLSPVALAPDRLSGSASFVLRVGGILRVVLVNEPGPRRLRTETALSVRVRPDAPPVFERIAGLAAQLCTAHPGELLHFSFLAVDDFGITTAELEWETAARKGAMPLLLDGTGTPRVEGRGAFDLAGAAGEGETVRFRLRIRDTRRLPNENLGPQETTFPADGWSEVKVMAASGPFEEQQILGQRDALRRTLDAVRDEVESLRTETEQLRADSAGNPVLPLDQVLRLGTLRERLRELLTRLGRSARESSLAVELDVLADRQRAVAAGPLRSADEALRLASVNDLHRANHWSEAIGSLAVAHAELGRLHAAGDRVAETRLNRRRIDRLLAEQNALLAASKPDAPDAIANRQRELLARLRRVVAESESLSRANAALALSEADRLAGEAERLAADVRRLDVAAHRLRTSVRQALLGELAAIQSGYTKHAVELARTTEAPARVATLPTIRPEEFQRVVQLLERDQLVEALTDLERLAVRLEKLSGEFESWAAERGDAKRAAAQFARWQADLRTRFRAAGATPALRDEQAVILASAEKLHIPAGSEAVSLLERAVVHLRLAIRRLDGGGADADVAMMLAVDAFDRLAAKLPSIPERHARSRTDLDKVRLEQDAIVSAAEVALRPFDKQPPTAAALQALTARFAPLATRQRKLSDKLASLDAPNHETRHARTVSAAKAAASDLKDGLPYDAVATLGAARRELERLRQALDGQAPADARLRTLAEKQSLALQLLRTAGERATVKQLEPIVSLQQEVFAAIGNVTAPEAPALLHDAREAVNLAEQALRDGSDHGRIVQRFRDAKEALMLLADRMGDRESERDRIRRIASNRRSSECSARKLAGKPANPDASNAARAELGRELDELLMTRVGPAGQAAKRKAIESYIRLQSRSEPDRQAAEQRQLADALTELAALMGDVAYLTTRPEPSPAVTDPADAYLPSKKLSEAFKTLATHERKLRERLNGLNAVAIERLSPSTDNPFTGLLSRQQNVAAAFADSMRNTPDGGLWHTVSVWAGVRAARRAADHLAVGDRNDARDAARLAVQLLRNRVDPKRIAEQEALLAELERVTVSTHAAAAQQKFQLEVLARRAKDLNLQVALAMADATDGGGPALAELATNARRAEQLLAEAVRKLAADQFEGAARIRVDAIELLERMSAGRSLDAATPDGVAVSVKAAERAMLRAVRELGPKGTPQAAAEAMKSSAAALLRARESLTLPR